MTTVVQDSLSDSDEILERIKTELLTAKSEILVAMAWFTNPELFDTIKENDYRQIFLS